MDQTTSKTSRKHRQEQQNTSNTSVQGKPWIQKYQKNVKDICMFTWVDAAAKKAAKNEPG